MEDARPETWQSIGQANTNEAELGFLWGANYGAIWHRDAEYPENAAYHDNQLYISNGGYRTAANILGNTSVRRSPIGIAAGLLAGGECHYWTSTNHTNSNGRAVQASFTNVLWLFSWSSITYTSEQKDQGRNVLCIRAMNHPNS